MLVIYTAHANGISHLGPIVSTGGIVATRSKRLICTSADGIAMGNLCFGMSTGALMLVMVLLHVQKGSGTRVLCRAAIPCSINSYASISEID